MRNHHILAFLLFTFFAFIKCSEEIPESIDVTMLHPNPDSYKSFPSGFDYPQEKDSINKWINKGDKHSIRKHSWNLFAGLNQKTEGWEKIWHTWYPIGVVFPQKDSIVTNPSLDPSLTRKDVPYPQANPKDYCFENGNLFFFTSLIFSGSTFYNHDAAEWIASKNLGHKEALEGFQKKGLKNIPMAPSTAIVMKNVYWPVSGRLQEYTPLPVWDGPGTRDPLVYNGFETWERAVAVTPNPNPPPTVSAEYLYYYANRENYFYKFEDLVPVGLDKFYYLELTSSVTKEFSAIDSCVVNNSFNYVFNRNFEEGDFLITVGQHIMAKEIDDWTMQTIWWHDKSNEGKYSKDRPKHVEGSPLQNYLLSTAYFMSDPTSPKPNNHIGFNPYIELTLAEKNRLRSNCQNCHVRAGYPELEGAFFIADPVGGPVKFPTEPTAHYHTLREGLIEKSDSIFNGIIRTDFNWGIADRAK